MGQFDKNIENNSNHKTNDHKEDIVEQSIDLNNQITINGNGNIDDDRKEANQSIEDQEVLQLENNEQTIENNVVTEDDLPLTNPANEDIKDEEGEEDEDKEQVKHDDQVVVVESEQVDQQSD